MTVAATVYPRYESQKDAADAAATINQAVEAAVAKMVAAGICEARSREVVAEAAGRECYKIHRRMTWEDSVMIVRHNGTTTITMRVQLVASGCDPGASGDTPTQYYRAATSEFDAEGSDPVVAIGQVISDHLKLLAADPSVLVEG